VTSSPRYDSGVKRTIPGLLLLLVGCSAPPADDDDASAASEPVCGASMFRGSPQRTGRIDAPLPASTPEVSWATNVFGEEVGGGQTWWGGFPQGDEFTDENGPTGDQIFLAASPQICGDRLVTAWRDGLVTAHDRHTGALLWTFEADADFDGTPALSEDQVVLGGTDARVRALSTTTGEEIWRQLLAQDTLASPAPVDGAVVFGDKSGRVVALETDGGDERWRIQRAQTVSSSPSYNADGSRLLLGEIGRVETSLTSPIFALDAVTGDGLWSVDAGAQVLSTAAFDGGTWYVGSFDNRLYALTEDGDVTWIHTSGANLSASPAVGPERVYIGGWDWTLVALDRADGEVAWSADLGSDALASPLLGTDGVLQVTEDGRLRVFEASTGELRWTFDRGAAIRTVATPAVAQDGTIYVAAVNGDLLALRE